MPGDGSSTAGTTLLRIDAQTALTDRGQRSESVVETQARPPRECGDQRAVGVLRQDGVPQRCRASQPQPPCDVPWPSAFYWLPQSRFFSLRRFASRPMRARVQKGRSPSAGERFLFKGPRRQGRDLAPYENDQVALGRFERPASKLPCLEPPSWECEQIPHNCQYRATHKEPRGTGGNPLQLSWHQIPGPVSSRRHTFHLPAET
jgi:hypothetical protein